jgi:hypothetical protein
MATMERSRDWLAQARRDLEKALAKEAIHAAESILRFSSDHLG